MELDLTKFPRGAKAQEYCGIEPTNDPLSLFKLKKAAGWWAFKASKKEEDEDKEDTEESCGLSCLSCLCCPLKCCCWCAGLKRTSPLTRIKVYFWAKLLRFKEKLLGTQFCMRVFETEPKAKATTEAPDEPDSDGPYRKKVCTYKGSSFFSVYKNRRTDLTPV